MNEIPEGLNDEDLLIRYIIYLVAESVDPFFKSITTINSVRSLMKVWRGDRDSLSIFSLEAIEVGKDIIYIQKEVLCQ